MLYHVVLLILLVLLAGFLTIMETALIGVSQAKIRQNTESGDKRAARLKYAMDNPPQFLPALQMLFFLVNLFSGVYAANSFTGSLALFLRRISLPFPMPVQEVIALLLVVIAFSYLLQVLGVLIPRRIALKKADALAWALINPITVLAKLCKPFVFLLSASAGLAVKLFGLDGETDEEEVTEEEIRLLVDVGGESGSIDESEMAMIHNVFEFDDKTAGDICVHRTEMVALQADTSEEEILRTLIDEKYSRVPVYGENLDDIIGILHVKDLMRQILRGERQDINLREIARKPHFVPLSKKLDDLFEEMRKNKSHLAVVLDEYGGTLGIISMEDLIEEVMGNIMDEYDEELPDIVSMDASTYTVNGMANLAAVAEALGVKLPGDEYDTLGGFIIGQIGHIPEEDEKVELEWNGLLFKVTDVRDNRIGHVTVIKLGE